MCHIATGQPKWNVKSMQNFVFLRVASDHNTNKHTNTHTGLKLINIIKKKKSMHIAVVCLCIYVVGFVRMWVWLSFTLWSIACVNPFILYFVLCSHTHKKSFRAFFSFFFISLSPVLIIQCSMSSLTRLYQKGKHKRRRKKDKKKRERDAPSGIHLTNYIV